MPQTKQVTITTNGNTLIADGSKMGSQNALEGSISVVQTTGTWALFASPDQGVSFIALKDASGTAVSRTANDTVNFYLGKGAPNKPMQIYINYSGIAGTSNVYVQSN